MSSYEQVIQTLESMNVPYDIVEHPPTHSTEDSDSFIEGYEGCRSKTLVFANKKSTEFYMVILDDRKRVDTKALQELLGVKRLHFASVERVEEMLGVEVGIFSQLGLIGTHYDNLHIYFDRESVEENRIQTYHPNVRDKTILFPMEACFRLLEEDGYTYELIDL